MSIEEHVYKGKLQGLAMLSEARRLPCPAILRLRDADEANEVRSPWEIQHVQLNAGNRGGL